MSQTTITPVTDAKGMPLACHPEAIAAADRPRYRILMAKVKAAIAERSAAGAEYLFKLDREAVTFEEATEWMTLERLCCPFLAMRLTAPSGQSHWLLTLTGPDGVKEVIDAALPVTG
ncbi:MAG: hypothetical protein JNL98_26045 [Bryobacterales bacterium]|nr:hypothetical protein [Bryobacterales bacterium]